MGTGMGVPSISIYATELAVDFGCRRLVRVGSCGAIVDGLGLHDIVAAIGAGTDSGVNRARIGGHDFAAVADFGLLRAVVEQAESAGVPVCGSARCSPPTSSTARRTTSTSASPSTACWP